jgi:hypothetical protein
VWAVPVAEHRGAGDGEARDPVRARAEVERHRHRLGVRGVKSSVGAVPATLAPSTSNASVYSFVPLPPVIVAAEARPRRRS